MANQAPIFTLTPVAKTGTCTVANTARDGSGTLVVVVSSGSAGTRIDRITARGTGQTQACLVTLFVNDGTNTFLIGEMTLAAVTAGTTTAGASVELVRTDGLPVCALPSGYSLRAGITVAPTSGSILVTAFGGDY